MNGKQFKQKPVCSIKSAPFPVEVTCPHCDIAIEIWSDEDKTWCRVCGYEVFNHEGITN